MPLAPTWTDIAVRLALTLAAGGIVGWDRGERGHSAGLRTVLLVGLAAAGAMLQANILLATTGKTPDAFATMDVMRLPLGILTGVGFIGGGAILKKGKLVLGLTTAATLWAITIIGLCFGGGQIVLGVATTLLTVAILTALKEAEARLPRLHRATLELVTQGGRPALTWFAPLAARGYRLDLLGSAFAKPDNQTTTRCAVSWKGPDAVDPTPLIFTALEDLDSLVSFAVALDDRH